MKTKSNLFLLRFALMALVLVSLGCSKDEKEQRDIDEAIIKEYLQQNNLQAERTSSGLYYIINDEGFGARPTASSQVTVAYKGYLTTGLVFDESAFGGLRFGLRQVIPGWTEGIPKFREGGNGVLLIPSHLGYGSRAVGDIPANSVLIFDIALIQVH